MSQNTPNRKSKMVKPSCVRSIHNKMALQTFTTKSQDRKGGNAPKTRRVQRQGGKRDIC